MTEGGGSTLKWHKMMNVERAHLAVLHSWTAEGDFQSLVTISFSAHLKIGTPELPSRKAPVSVLRVQVGFQTK